MNAKAIMTIALRLMGFSILLSSGFAHFLVVDFVCVDG